MSDTRNSRLVGWTVVSYEDSGSPANDWDGELHTSRSDAEVALAAANAPLDADDPVSTQWFLAEVYAVDLDAMNNAYDEAASAGVAPQSADPALASLTVDAAVSA